MKEVGKAKGFRRGVPTVHSIAVMNEIGQMLARLSAIGRRDQEKGEKMAGREEFADCTLPARTESVQRKKSVETANDKTAMIATKQAGRRPWAGG